MSVSDPPLEDEDSEGPGSAPETDDQGPRAITRRPATLSGTLALVTAGLVTLLAAAVSIPAIAAGSLGLVSIGVSVTYGNRGLADLGGAGLLAATVLAGTAGVEAVALACAVGTVLAWDLATNAIDIGQQLGREPDTTSIELVHAGGTLAVGLLTAGTSYVIYRSAAGGQPVAAVFFLLLAALALVSSLRL